ncbi:MAG: transcriptional repressor [Treponema sp.]|jgi:Fur family ferric uptake transcriptional regulator|nr:transcriptional repressor [Treponema sp.]
MGQSRPVNYRTRQGQRILDYMKSLGGGHVTVGQMVRHFADGEEVIGQTTIYRHLEKLAAEGKIRKYALRDGKSACYQYVDDGVKCREHFHLKCEICGGLIHADCDLLDEITRHLLVKHHFQIDLLKTTFYGTCKKCLSAGRAGRTVRMAAKEAKA